MARRAPAPSDPDDGDIQPEPMAEEGGGKLVRKSAQGAHKVWDELKPKSRAPKRDGEEKEKEKKEKTYAKPGGAKAVAPSGRSLATATKYPAPNIDLDTSNDESPAPRARTSKGARTASSNEGSQNELDAEDEAPVKSSRSRFAQPKGKTKASSDPSEEEGSSDSGEGEDEDDEESSGPSELEELEEKDPSALQAKFDSEAPTWVDGADEDFDVGLALFPPSPVISHHSAATNLDIIDRTPSKRPRADSPYASEAEDQVQPEPRPIKKRVKSVTSIAGRGKGPEDGEEDTDEGAPSIDEQNDLARDRAAERKRRRKREERHKREHEEQRKRKREEQRERVKERERAERAKEQHRAEHAKERAKERERQRIDLKKLQEHQKECERREQEERKQEDERRRKKEREREREHEREKARERKLDLALEMEREYEREHDEVRRQVLGKAKKHHGRNDREHDEIDDEPDARRDKRRVKAKARPERTTGPSRSSTSSKTERRTRTTPLISKGGHQAGGKTTADQSTKRKRGKQDEEVRFMSDEGSSGSNEEPPSRKQRQNDDAPPSSDEDDDDRTIDIIWFGNSRPNLTDQHPRVRQVANLAISDCELSVCTVNVFPDDPDNDGTFMRDILVKHAKSLGYKDVVQRLRDRKDSNYWKKLGTIPSQRVFLLRGRVKSKCEGAVWAAYNLVIGDAEKVAWLEKDLAYIYPHDYKNRTVNGKEGFKAPIFENMLISSFFSRRQSYGHRISKHFKSSHPDKPDEKEIPAPMLALVSTAIFAAIDDFKHAHYDAAKFEVNLNLHVYRRNIAFLDHIKDKNIDAFHTLMHGLFKHVMGGVGGASNSLGHGLGYLDVDGMDRE